MVKLDGLTVLREEREILHALKDDQNIAADLETSGLNPQTEKIAVLTLYGRESSALGVLHLRGRQFSKDLKALMEDRARTFVWHNGVSFDLCFLLANGVKATKARIYDTMVGAGVALTNSRANQSKSLQAEIERRFKVHIDKKTNHSSWMSAELSDDQIRYCGEDILHLHALRQSQQETITKERMTNALALEMEIVGTVAQMTHNGLPICIPKLDEYLYRRARELEHYESELAKRFPEVTNFGSHTQVRKILTDLGMKLPTAYDKITRKHKETTQAPALEAVVKRGIQGLLMNNMVHQFEGETSDQFTGRCENILLTLEQILRARECKKTGSSYSDEWIAQWTTEQPAKGVPTRAVKNIRWVHPKFRQAGTDTMRFSSSEPNFQQWPKAMRGVIGGVITGPHSPFAEDEQMDIVSADYSQIEVVIAAVQAGDQVLMDVIRSGEDIHRMVASQIFNISPESVSDYQRRIAKACSFCLIFGGGPATLMEYALGYGAVLTLNESAAISDQFFARFTGLAKMKEKAIRDAHYYKNIMSIPLANGSRRDLVGSKISPPVILNTNIQGNAAAGMKFAILEATKAGLARHLAASVHDELVAVVPKKYSKEYAEALEQAMLAGMRKVIDFPVKVGVTIGSFWS